MLKTALYGMIRVSFDLMGQPIWWWGLVPLSLGLFSALYGVVFAAAQTDMKRLLAYSSIENIGILLPALDSRSYSRVLRCAQRRHLR